jgi:hypothetical protein
MKGKSHGRGHRKMRARKYLKPELRNIKTMPVHSGNKKLNNKRDTKKMKFKHRASGIIIDDPKTVIALPGYDILNEIWIRTHN